jgi:hypothetical protein
MIAAAGMFILVGLALVGLLRILALIDPRQPGDLRPPPPPRRNGPVIDVTSRRIDGRQLPAPHTFN